MKKIKLLPIAMMFVAIVTMSVSCENGSTKPETLETLAAPKIIIPDGHNKDKFDFRVPITFMNDTDGITFHYTTNGSVPTTSSESGNPVTLPSFEGDATSFDFITLKVIAVKAGYLNSAVASELFTPKSIVKKPSINPTDKEYFVVQDDKNLNISISSTTEGAEIYYTDDGTTPVVDAGTPRGTTALYSEPFEIIKTTTVKAIAIKKDYGNSDEVTAIFTQKQVDNPIITPNGDGFIGSKAVTIASATIDATIYYTLDGSTPSVNTDGTPKDATKLYSGNFGVTNEGTVVKALATRKGYVDSDILEETFTQARVGKPAIIPTSEYIDYSKPITFTSATSGVTFYYTTDGTAPSATSTQGNNIIFTESNDYIIKVFAKKEGYLDSEMTERTFKKAKVETPRINIPDGQIANKFEFDQPITFTSSTEGASFSYTINGGGSTDGSSLTLSTLTDNKNVYTIKVTAKKAGYHDSAVIEMEFTEKKEVSITISPAPTSVLITKGVFFDTTQTVTLSSDPTNAYIYYTLDGTTPEVDDTDDELNLLGTTTLYGDTFNIDKTTTVKMLAIPITIERDGLQVRDSYNSKVKTVIFTKRVIPTVLVNGGTLSRIAYDSDGEPILDDGKTTTEEIFVADFYMGTTEVTQQQYLAVMSRGEDNYIDNPSRHKTANWKNSPVEQVTVIEAAKFCNKLNEMEGILPYYEFVPALPLGIRIIGNKGYRLPTEVEWQYAAGGGTKIGTMYAGTNDLTSLSNYAVYDLAEKEAPSEVRSKSPNALDLYDMSGNVYELVYDPEQLGAISCGGGYYSAGKNCTVLTKFVAGNKTTRYGDIGFRIVRSE